MSPKPKPKSHQAKELIPPTIPISDIIQDIKKRSFETDLNVVLSTNKGFLRKLKFFRFYKNQISYNPRYGKEIEFLISFNYSVVGYELSQDDLITEGLLKPAEDYETVRIDL